MIKEYYKYTPLWKFNNLKEIANLVHFVTSRIGGYSKGEFESLNMSDKVGDLPNNVKANRKKLYELLGVIPENVFIPHQTHSNKVGVVITTSEPEDFEDTDALITKAKGICVAVLSADCVPILLFDSKKEVVAAIHAGWRGSVGNIVGNTIKLMKQQYGSNPENIIATIGPCIALEHYEVGSEVINEVKSSFDDYKLFLKPGYEPNKMYLDLKELNKFLLIKEGVVPLNIEMSEFSTFDQGNDFFSARRQGFNCGRFASGIMMV